MILIDANIPMYLVGAEHPNKLAAQRALEDLIDRQERLVTDAEVLQEIVHRYVAIGRPDAIQPAFDALLGLAEEVFPVTERDVLGAKDIVLGSYGLSVRDALHVSIMRTHQVSRILSFDSAFDKVPGLSRIS